MTAIADACSHERMRYVLACTFALFACTAETSAPEAVVDASIDARDDTATTKDTSVGDTSGGGCARFGFVASGASCPSTGCAAVNCTCPGTFPRSITACTKDGCIVSAKCSEVCAASSLGDALSCTDTHTVGGDGGTSDSGTSDAKSDACTPATCALLAKNCGTVDVGCGKSVDCGTCVSPQTCGGGGAANVCGCTKTTCSAAGAECGDIPDGCGGTLTCGGACTSPKWCGGGGTANKCGCVPSGSITKSGSVASNVANGTATRTWDTPENVFLSDNKKATISAMVNGEVSQYLVVKGFGFTLPTSAVVSGIVVEVERSSLSSGVPLGDASAKIVKGASIVGTEKARTDDWPTSDTVVSYGGTSDLWGQTWTIADINSPDFGFAIAAKYKTTAGNNWAYIDHVKITVYFTVPGC